ncbi:hypothetical protein ACWDBF_33350 [Streptomyces angustmyceticus]
MGNRFGGAHPGILPEDTDGRRRRPGGRQQYCPVGRVTLEPRGVAVLTDPGA